MERLEITNPHTHERFTILRLEGSLDADGAATLDEHACKVMESGRHLVLHLAGIQFMSSTGIGVLLALSEEFQERGLSVRLSAPSKAVSGPIELLCLDRFLNLYDSDDQASADLAA